MTREEIIQGLQFTIDMFLFDPSTGELITNPRNDMDKTTIDACKGAIKELHDNSYELWKESYEVEHERNIRLEEKIKALEQESVSREVYDHEYALRKEFEIKAYKLQRQLEKAEHNIDKIKADIEHLEEGIIRMSKLAML